MCSEIRVNNFSAGQESVRLYKTEGKRSALTIPYSTQDFKKFQIYIHFSSNCCNLLFPNISMAFDKVSLDDAQLCKKNTDNTTCYEENEYINKNSTQKLTLLHQPEPVL